MRLLKHDLNKKSLTRFYVAYIKPVFEYACCSSGIICSFPILDTV